jgi:hypothetical protein
MFRPSHHHHVNVMLLAKNILAAKQALFSELQHSYLISRS